MPAPQKPPTPLYTVILVSDHSQAVRRFLVPRPWLRRAAWAGGAAVLVALLTMGHYFALLGASSENRVLKEENAQLRSQILLVQEKVAHISSTLGQVERFDAKLRTAVTQLQDPERNAPMPAASPPSPSAEPAAAAPVAEPADRPIPSAVPTLWPTRGWLTSGFGVRVDPVTAERTMHRGVDIATAPGAPVVAPSDGVVLYAGMDGVYGNLLVLDHGCGVRTRYGHLAEIAVARGQAVKRGTAIAMVGNTGRSTGPHLHYEVQVDGIAENPSRFVKE